MSKSVKSKSNDLACALRQFYPQGGSTLAVAMGEALEGGKLLRAELLLECHRLCGGAGEDRALAAAAAAEMVHAYSLVHDDLPAMDDSDIRRGKPSCHRKYGEAMAILVGDGLLTLAFETLAKAGLVRQAASLAAAAGYRGMLEGQLRDLSANGGDVFAIYSLKTAALFAWAARTGAELAAPTRAGEFAQFGNRFGMLFQLADDLTDGQIGKEAAERHLAGLKAALLGFADKQPPQSSLKPMVEGVLKSFGQ